MAKLCVRVGVRQSILIKQSLCNYAPQCSANNSAEVQTRSLVLAVPCGLDSQYRIVGSTFALILSVCMCACVYGCMGVWV